MVIDQKIMQKSSRPFVRQERDLSLEKESLQIDRISRQTKGGIRFRFRVLILVKDKEKKSISFAQAKGNDVATAIRKATKQAKKRLITYFIDTPRTIPYHITNHFKATQILLKPAPAGTGIIAGNTLNLVFKYLGVKDISAKVIGSTNKLNVVKCVFQALDKITGQKRSN